VTGSIALAAVGILLLAGYGPLSIPVVYLGYTWLFHFSLSFICSACPGLWEIAPSNFSEWAKESYWNAALVYSMLCCCACAGACTASLLLYAPRTQERLPGDCSVVLYRFGVALSVASAIALVWGLISAGGIDVLSRSYLKNFSEGVFGRAFFGSVHYFSFGTSFACAAASKHDLWKPVALQISTSVLLILLGARGPALVGILVMVLVLHKRGLRIRFGQAVIAIIAVLYLISIVKQVRDLEEGILGSNKTRISFSAIGGLLELGGTLRTVSLIMQWMDEDPDALQWGRTYLYPVERILGLAIPELRTNPFEDLRNFGAAVRSREAYLGGSVIGESFYNFGMFGVLMFLPIGFFLGLLELRSQSCYCLAATAVVVYCLLYYVRDYFLPVPMSILTGLAILFVINQVDAYVRYRRRARSVGSYKPHAEVYGDGN